MNAKPTPPVVKKTDKPDLSKPDRRLIFEDFQTGERRQFDLFICPERTDQFKVFVNGQLWQPRIGFTHVLTALRKAAGRFTTLPV